MPSEIKNCPLCNRSVRGRKFQNHIKRNHPKEYEYILKSRLYKKGTRLGKKDYNKLEKLKNG